MAVDADAQKITQKETRPTSIAVVVLGDLDRSPRMLNHALSAAEHGHNVTLVGYQGSSLPASIVAYQ